jgi:antitoxin component YwqK of YwqJK toxin-antitoxin module
LFPGFIHAQEINQFDADGQRHGKWSKNFEDTDQMRYQGQFDHGKEIGLFNYYKLIGKKSKLAATKEFNANDNTAQVKFLSLGGKIISEGKMTDKLFVGKWVYYHKNSDVIMTIENYNEQGELHGKKQVFYDNAQLAEEIDYVNGKMHGTSKHYAVNGVLVKSYIYENDELHGMSKHYDGNGTILIDGRYKRGKKTGVWNYYSNGKVVKQKDYTYIPKYKKKQ